MVKLLLGVFLMAGASVETKLEKATFAGGCFWGVEHIFSQQEGVKDAVSGYAGGSVENPSYNHVSSGTTGHAEVVQVTYDPEKIKYEKLLELFMRMHDPTQVDRQGPDVGNQYRSAIFYHNDKQKKAAQELISKLTKTKVFKKPIATKVEKLDKFYKAEDYHQDYYVKTKKEPYCHALRPSFAL